MTTDEHWNLLLIALNGHAGIVQQRRRDAQRTGRVAVEADMVRELQRIEKTRKWLQAKRKEEA